MCGLPVTLATSLATRLLRWPGHYQPGGNQYSAAILPFYSAERNRENPRSIPGKTLGFWRDMAFSLNILVEARSTFRLRGTHEMIVLV